MATKVLYAVPVAHEAACRRSSACAPRAASSTSNRTGRTLIRHDRGTTQCNAVNAEETPHGRPGNRKKEPDRLSQDESS